MKKVMFMAAAMLLSVTVVFAGSIHTGNNSPDTAKKAKAAKVLYTCPMHADVVSTKPGKCPKPGCGMTLVKKTDAAKKPAMKM